MPVITLIFMSRVSLSPNFPKTRVAPDLKTHRKRDGFYNCDNDYYSSTAGASASSTLTSGSSTTGVGASS